MANALFLDEACVRQLVTMEDALAAVEEVFGEQGRGHAVNVPRVCAPVKGGILCITAAVLSYRGYYAVCAVRPIREVRVWSPTPASRDAFCADVKNINKINALSVLSPEQAVRGADVLVTATTATAPVVHGAWLCGSEYSSGAHYRYALKHGIGADELAALDHGDYGGLAPREAAALRFAEAMVRGQGKVDDAAYAALQAHFNAAEIVEIAALAGIMQLASTLGAVFELAPD